jgi:hypothetical protein
MMENCPIVLYRESHTYGQHLTVINEIFQALQFKSLLHLLSLCIVNDQKGPISHMLTNIQDPII